ncbi:hypothetical protein CGLO_11819 [Colletotrichum gloeosporioides Cg-14]|uniref:Uncharacterized protein n=1 Tax=Colletotrichum gloeosporioides (strain Cg-14) TaxID=1237896 RepID=T0K7F3_COLGC|nr:hypothetical protein CGLO_11819 [Colletotrichum gloeosporioides Cg-14]
MLSGANDHPNTSSRPAPLGSMTQGTKDSQDEKNMPAHGQWVRSALPFMGTDTEGSFETSEGRDRSAIQAALGAGEVHDQIIPEPEEGPDGQMAPTDQDLDTDTVINTVIYILQTLANASAPNAAEDHVNEYSGTKLPETRRQSTLSVGQINEPICQDGLPPRKSDPTP